MPFAFGTIFAISKWCAKTEIKFLRIFLIFFSCKADTTLYNHDIRKRERKWKRLWSFSCRIAATLRATRIMLSAPGVVSIVRLSLRNTSGTIFPDTMMVRLSLRNTSGTTFQATMMVSGDTSLEGLTG